MEEGGTAVVSQGNVNSQRSGRQDEDYDSEQGNDGDSCNTPSDESKHTNMPVHCLTGEWVRSAVGLGPEDWTGAQRSLGECIFEQKWLDLTCGELCDQARKPGATCFLEWKVPVEHEYRPNDISDVQHLRTRIFPDTIPMFRSINRSLENWVTWCVAKL